MHLNVDRPVAAITVVAVILAVVLLFAAMAVAPRLPAEIWPNVLPLVA